MLEWLPSMHGKYLAFHPSRFNSMFPTGITTLDNQEPGWCKVAFYYANVGALIVKLPPTKKFADLRATDVAIILAHADCLDVHVVTTTDALFRPFPLCPSVCDIPWCDKKLPVDCRTRRVLLRCRCACGLHFVCSPECRAACRDVHDSDCVYQIARKLAGC